MPSALRSALLLALVVAAGCGSQQIPNTRVEDTAENREVIDFVEEYRTAVERRDTVKLLSLASHDYYDDMGTPGGEDDIDYEGLTQGLSRLKDGLLAARYQISYRGLTYASHDRILVDMLYTGWFRVETTDGPQWRRRLEPHRIVLGREGEQLRILSGM